ncbi:tetratricopeptide repeat protein [Sorangium sp. So ce1151]|uniref:tetratricopeptide repeat protein n=1 Tax=Sorangium sp. So ce1151 TaxID=3133332 RepID=UPI003F603AA4
MEELIREADAAVERLEVAQARELWAEVYEIDGLTIAICTMGQLDARMGRWEEAATELSRCVERMPAPRTELQRRRYEGRRADLAAARRRVGEVRILPPPGVVGMLVNGRGVKDGNRVYVAPGQHEVTAVGPEGQVARASVKVEAGESKPVPLAFEKPGPVPRGGAQAPNGAQRPAGPRKPTQPGPDLRIVVTGAMASIGLLVTGAVCLQSSQGYIQEAAAAKRDARLRWEFDPTFRPDYDAWIDAAASGKQMRFAGTGSLVLGATAGVGTLVYLWLPRDIQVRVATQGAEVRLRW